MKILPTRNLILHTFIPFNTVAMHTRFLILLSITFSFPLYSNDKEWKQIHYFEKVDTIKIQHIRYMPPIVFELGNFQENQNYEEPQWGFLLNLIYSWPEKIDDLKKYYSEEYIQQMDLSRFSEYSINRKKLASIDKYKKYYIFSETKIITKKREFSLLETSFNKEYPKEYFQGKLLEFRNGKWIHQILPLPDVDILKRLPLDKGESGDPLIIELLNKHDNFYWDNSQDFPKIKPIIN